MGGSATMNNQIHKRLSNDQARAILEKYEHKEIRADKARDLLGIKRRQFFEWAKRYRKDPLHFTIEYRRQGIPRKIASDTERAILKALKSEKRLVDDKNVPIRFYNYSYIQNQLVQKDISVSVPTIISRAKKYGFYIPKPDKKKHDREVITNYPGELIQHDSSHHLFSPHSDQKWYLITSIDDYSRFILYGNLFERETSWRHIEALEYVFTTKGVPLKYYVDSHSIFRYIEQRDSLYHKYVLKEDEADIQWKKVLRDLKVSVAYALSPQAKGKVERPYQWMQDHLVRTCYRENIKKIDAGREILKKELNHYNYHQIHSTTQEVPIMRFEKALKEKRTLFRPFKIPPPFESSNDIFSLRYERTINAYRKISFEGLELRVPADPYEKVELRIIPNEKTQMTEIRIWHRNKLIDVQKIKNQDLKQQHF